MGILNDYSKRYKIASMGIGAMIVFIAMVLVAGIAASVLVQTAETLQYRTYAVGTQTIHDVSSGMRVISVTGYANAEKTVIQYLAIAITPRAGSYDLDLNKTLLYITYDNFSVLHLNTNCKSATVADGGIFSTLNQSELTATEFGAISIHDRDNSIYNYNGMHVSDQVVLVVNLKAVLNATGGLLPGDDLNLKIVPEIGASGIFSATAPNTFGYRVVEL